jgi:hypothetical protein
VLLNYLTMAESEEEETEVAIERKGARDGAAMGRGKATDGPVQKESQA